jgi:hypoxanthine phosphoribosyltransferase
MTFKASKLLSLPLIGSLFRRLKDRLKGNQSPNLSRTFLLARSIKRRKLEGTFIFRSLEDLTLACQKIADKIPNTYDLIVGVPRSGLFPATFLSLKFGRPLLAAGLGEEVKPWLSGSSERGIGKPGRILVVDDSATTGAAVLKARDEIMARYPDAVVHTAVIFAAPNTISLVDYYAESVPQPRFFEWNLMHSKQGILASDMDGVLCDNCPPGVSDNEEAYVAWMKSAKAHLIPGFKVDYIVTNRFERHRNITETWLKEHGVDYGELLMSPLMQKPETNGHQIEHKVSRLCEIKPDIFWESSEWEAENVWRKTRVPTLCVDEMVFYA